MSELKKNSITSEEIHSQNKGISSLGFHGLLMLVGKNKHFLFGVPLLIAATVGIISSTSQPYYKSVSRVLPPQYNQYSATSLNKEFGGDSSFGNAAVALKNPSDLYVGILRSTTILNGVIFRLNLTQHYHLKVLDDLQSKLNAATEISVGKEGIISIYVEDKSSEMAAMIANAFVEELYALSLDFSQRESKRRAVFYEKVLSEAKEKLNKADFDLLEVEIRTGYSALKGQDEAIISAAANTAEQIAKRKVDLGSLLSYETDKNPDVIALRGEISNLENQLRDLKRGAFYQPEKPLNKALPQTDSEKSLKTKNSDSDVKTPTESGKAGYASPAKLGEVSIGQAPRALLEFNQKYREVDYWKKSIDLLGRYSELGSVDETRDISLVQWLDKAAPSHYKSKPNGKLAMIMTYAFSWLMCFFYLVFTKSMKMMRKNSPSFDKATQDLTDVWLPPKFRTKILFLVQILNVLKNAIARMLVRHMNRFFAYLKQSRLGRFVLNKRLKISNKLEQFIQYLNSKIDKK